MIDLTSLIQRLSGTPLSGWASTLQTQLDAKLTIGHGDLQRWQRALDALPALSPSHVELAEAFRLDAGCEAPVRAQLREALLGL
jgi:tRNA (mo5U34)-methyltransferase